jgi:hypothetical protein
MDRQTNSAENFVIEILEFAISKIRAGKCSPKELGRVAQILSEEMNVEASIEDMAEHFGRSKNNVSNVIHRSYVGKPERKVVYNFAKFLKIIPSSWRRR